MGIFDFLGKAADNIVQQSDSNNMMEKYVGETPFTYQKKVYQGVLASAMGVQDRLVKLGLEPLSVPELSMLRLAIFANLADREGDEELRRKYIKAAEKLGTDYINAIRKDVQDACLDVCPLMCRPRRS
jgi:hypothetical protein